MRYEVGMCSAVRSGMSGVILSTVESNATLGKAPNDTAEYLGGR